MMRLLIDLALVVVLCTLYVRAQESKREAEDCRSFNKIAKQIETAGKQFGVTNTCRSFRNCSGLHCSGNVMGQQFFISMGLQHCQNPVRLWLHLVAPNLKLDEWRVLKDGIKTDIVKDLQVSLLPVSAYVVPKLKVKNNNITIGGQLCYKLLAGLQCITMNDIGLPISKKMCSINGTFPHSNPTGRTKMTPKRTETGRSKVQRMSTAKPTLTTDMDLGTTSKSDPSMTSTGPVVKSSKGSAHTAPSRAHKTVTDSKVSKHSHQHEQSNTGHGRKSKAKGGLTTGTTVALVTSVLLIAMLILGVVLYWRKLKKRRPAYYNDINVNREDEDPFFDSHLVL